MPMADVCHQHLHTRSSWLPASQQFLLKDDLHSMSSTWPEQCQQGCLAAKRDILRAWHPQVLCSDNNPQYASAQFADFCISWGITHKTSSQHYPQSNGFVETCIKSVKHALQWDKYSGANPHLTLLVLTAMPLDTKLPSPAELLYQQQLRTTIPAKICNNDSSIQVCEQINTCSEAAKSQTDKCSKTLVPLYAGQPVAMYDTLRKIWIPATVIHVLPWNSYQVCTSNGSIYHHMQRHLCECSVKAVKTVPSGTTATPQALTRHCFSAAHLHSACSPHPLHLQHQ